jgi:hypothetical protein
VELLLESYRENVAKEAPGNAVWDTLRTRARITWSILVVQASGLPYITQAGTPVPQ